MLQAKSKLDDLIFPWVFIAFFLGLGLLLVDNYASEIDADGLSYINVAKKYLNREFTAALNGYWSPLYSWLMTPFLKFIKNPLLASKILNLGIGAFILWVLDQLGQNLHFIKQIRQLVLIISFPILYYFSYALTTPDLLLSGITILYLFLILKNYKKLNLTGWFFIGLIGGLGYLAKLYFFYFFLVHFSFFSFFLFLNNSSKLVRKKIISGYFISIVTFLLICGGWVFLLYQKYHKLTLGTASGYTMSIYGPGRSNDYHGFNLGFLPPPDAFSISAWDDPSLVPVDNWNPFSSWNDFQYLIGLAINNLKKTFWFLVTFSPLAIIILFGYLLVLKNQLIKKVSILATFFIFPAGYLPVIAERRYLWSLNLLLIIIGARVLFSLKKIMNKRQVIYFLVVYFFILSFWILPLDYLIKPINFGREIYNRYQLIKNYRIKGNIASNARWDESTYLAYYLESKYYGMHKKNISVSQLISDFKKYQIDYYFCWDDCLPEVYLNQFEEITKAEFPDLRIYRISFVPKLPRL